VSRSPHDRLGPEGIARARAQRAAETALGEPARLVVWTPVLQTFITDAGRVAHVWTVAGEYREGITELRKGLFVDSGLPKLILWLGSNIGNLDRPEAVEFLRCLRALMDAEDRLLVGIDLRKDRRMLEEAYDDAQGVTAEFNRNILARINRELGGEFDLSRFHHRARYDEKIGRVEMHLESALAQTVPIAALDLAVHFGAGEMIHTENSYKYSHAEIEETVAAAGLRVECQWLDRARLFTLNLIAPSHS